MKRFATLVVALLIAIPAWAMDWENQSAKMQKSVQRMEITRTDAYGNTGTGACTAFSINDLRDYFLTAAHCFGDKMTVGGHDARVVMIDEGADLMVLQVPESGEVPEVKPAKPRNCKDGHVAAACQGQEIAAMGFGFGAPVPLLKTGHVSWPAVAIPGWGFGVDEIMLLSDFAYIPGMSGGPVFDANGKIVGIVQWGDDGNYVGGGRYITEVMEKTGKYWGVNDDKKQHEQQKAADGVTRVERTERLCGRVDSGISCRGVR